MEDVLLKSPMIVLAAAMALLIAAVGAIVAARAYAASIRQDALALQQMLRDMQENYADAMKAVDVTNATIGRFTKEVQSLQLEVARMAGGLAQQRFPLQDFKREVDAAFQSEDVRAFLRTVREEER